VSQADSNKDLLHPSFSSLQFLSLGSFAQALAGRYCCSKVVAQAVEEEVVVVAFSLVLVGVGSVALLGEALMRQREVGGFPPPVLETLVEKGCCAAGDELGRQAGLQEG